MHADWALVSAFTPVEGSERPDLCMYVVPMTDVKIIDTWHVSGMAATGSNDIAVDDVFVPAHLMQSLGKVRNGTAEGASVSDSHLYRMPMVGVLGLTAAAPAVGAARKVVRLFTERMKTRTLYGTTTKQAERGVAHHRLGMVALHARNAELLLMQLARDVEDYGRRGAPCSDAEQAFLRLRIGDVVRQSRQVVRDVVDASGASAHFLDSPLQRFQRDLNTLSCHTIFDTDISGEQVGRSLLGLPA
jgi:alkylation response protein AidB-like acyl-CoA dehydrogenase